MRSRFVELLDYEGHQEACPPFARFSWEARESVTRASIVRKDCRASQEYVLKVVSPERQRTENTVREGHMSFDVAWKRKRIGVQFLAGVLQRDRYTKHKRSTQRHMSICFMLRSLISNLAVIHVKKAQSNSGPHGIEPARRGCHNLADEIAESLLRAIYTELEAYGQLTDFVGYPYRSGCKDSAWDFRQADGRLCIMGNHADLFDHAIAILTRKLSRQGLVIQELAFRHARIVFPTKVKGRYVRMGLGLSWKLASIHEGRLLRGGQPTR